MKKNSRILIVLFVAIMLFTGCRKYFVNDKVEDNINNDNVKKEKTIIEAFTGIGIGLLASCLFSPDSTRRLIIIGAGIILICIGWYKKAKYDKQVIELLDKKL